MCFVAQDYLEKFGYIAPPRNGTAALRSQQALVDAVKDFQRFAGLRVTGECGRRTARTAGSLCRSPPPPTVVGARNLRFVCPAKERPLPLGSLDKFDVTETPFSNVQSLTRVPPTFDGASTVGGHLTRDYTQSVIGQMIGL